MFIETKNGRSFLGRFECGDDLLSALTDFCKQNQIKMGVFNLIGAVQKAMMGYYNQEKKEYVDCINLNKKLEISACMGNISLKDNEIMVHAHITLSDYNGKTYGGHLRPGTIVFAAEFFIQELCGKQLIRGKDENTGLPLWKP